MTMISQSQRSLMSEDSGLGQAAMEDHTEVWVSEATDLLEKHQLDEAEALFCRVLQDLSDTNPDKERLAVSTLVGLAEIYSKRGRSMRYNLLEWYRMLMQAAAFQEEVQVVCQKVLSEAPEGMSVPRTWLEEAKSRSYMQLGVLEDCIVSSMQNNVNQAAAHKKPGDEDANGEVQVGWLNYLQKYCCEKQGRDRKGSSDNALPDIIGCSESDDSSGSVHNLPVIHRKINFDQVQGAIMTLVKDITADLRRRHRRKKLSEETLKRSLSFEMINKLSPAAEHTDIVSMFENAIIYEESDRERAQSESGSGSKDGEMSEDDTYLTDPYPMEIIHSDVTATSGQHSDTAMSIITEEYIAFSNQVLTTSVQSSSHTESGMPDSLHMTPRGNNHTTTRASPDNRVTQHLAPYGPTSTDGWQQQQELKPKQKPRLMRLPSEEISGEKYDIPGILTIWRSYHKPASLHQQARKYNLHSFEEVSPLTETGKFFETSTLYEVDESATEAKYLEQNLLSEERMKNTLSCMIAKVAEKLQKEAKYKEAIELYKFAMGLFQELPISQLNPNTIGHILKNIGMIKCAEGDMEGGTQLMEEALVMFGAEEEDSLYAAEVLFEMGNAYMAEHWKESSLFTHVMKLVKNDVDNEIKVELSQEDDAGDMADDDDSDSSESGESYTVCTHEAMSCYNQALAILIRLRKQQEEHTSLYVDVLTKLADCCIMVSDYDRAILCYEEALYLFRNALGQASLPNNAHVLSMLGTTNFLLNNYPKAVSMYETANILQQHLQDGEEGGSFGYAFTLTMLGISFYIMKHYQKCIGWCMRAYDTYINLYSEQLEKVETLQQWFIIQTLYTLGFSYSTVSFQEKALYYLYLSKDLIQKAEEKDIKQLVRVLKSVADIYNTTEDHENALTYYKEALEESHKLGDERTATALQNQLLNKIAGVHVSTKQYSTAAEYLEKALDYQKNVQSSIHGDLLDIMHQLGITYTLSGDIDRAIDCYRDCYDTYQDMHGSPTTDMTFTLSKLGTLYHVKACIQDEGELMEEEYLRKADECYQHAVRLDPHSGVCIQYANFLYQQGQSGDALLTMLPVLFCKRYQSCGSLVYHGVEQAVLPDHLQHEMTDMDEFTVETSVFANFLAILCYKHLLMVKDAEDCLIQMYKYVTISRVALNHSLLGYALLEMEMYEEAAESFLHAAQLQQAKELSITNVSVSVYLWIYSVIVTSMYGVWYELCKPFDIDMPIDEPKVTWYVSKAQEPVTYDAETWDTEAEPVEEEEEETVTNQIEDSGYYEHNLTKVSEPKPEETWETEETVVTPSAILEAIRKKTAMVRNKFEGKETDETETVDILSTIRLEAAQRYAPSRSPKYGLSKTETKKSDITESGYLEDFDKEKAGGDEEWVVKDDTVDTSEEILRTMGVSSEITLDYNTEHNETETEETWITEDSISVETPMEILKLIQLKGSYLSDMVEDQQGKVDDSESKMPDEMKEVDDNDGYGLHSEITIEETPTVTMTAVSEENLASSPHEEQYNSGEWITTEEVVETPLELLRQLQLSSGAGESQQEAHEPSLSQEEWVSEEVAVELPEDILRQIKSQQQGSRIPWKTEPEVTNNGTGVQEEEAEEEWITTEGTVEMPKEVLDFIREQEEKQQQQQKSQTTNIVSSVNISTSSSSSFRDQKSADTSETDTSYGGYQSRFSRWSSYREPPPPAESDTTWSRNNQVTETTVATDTAILNAINGNTQSNLSQRYTTTGNTQEYNQNTSVGDDEEVWQTWETTEETVDAPPELLAILAQQQQRS